MIYHIEVTETGPNKFLLPIDHRFVGKLKETRLGQFIVEREGLVTFNERAGAEMACDVMGNHADNLSNCGNPWFAFNPKVLDKQDAHLEIIVRVLTYQGRSEHAADDIAPHIKAISDRYGELRGEISFSDAATVARIEWLKKFITQ